MLDLVPVINAPIVVNDRGDAGGRLSLVAAIARAAPTRYDVVIDMQGLLKSAVIARRVGRARA